MENKENKKFEVSETEPNSNQQDKIVAAIERDDLSYLGHAYVRVDSDERGHFIDSIAHDEITDKDFTKVLRTIVSPMDRALSSVDEMNRVFDSVTSSYIPEHRQMMGIVAYFARHNMADRDNVSTTDLKSFYSEYPDPIVFREPLNNFMSEFSKVNNDRKVAEYSSSAGKLESSLYGKKYEYFQQIELLEREARAKKMGETVINLTNENNF
jgi:hypothetical protein